MNTVVQIGERIEQSLVGAGYSHQPPDDPPDFRRPYGSVSIRAERGVVQIDVRRDQATVLRDALNELLAMFDMIDAGQADRVDVQVAYGPDGEPAEARRYVDGQAVDATGVPA